MPTPVQPLSDLTALHGQIYEFLLQQDRSAGKATGAKRLDTFNSKGDRQYAFDREVHDLIFRYLKEHFPNGEVVSEESAVPERFGENGPLYRFVCDPVDGSDNFSRGLPLSSSSLAVLAFDAPLSIENVLYAMVGNLAYSQPAIATKGEGAWENNKALRVSAVQQYKDAFVSCELNHFQPDQKLGALLRDARAVRSYGCASQAIVQIAQGALDVHIDIRFRLTPESFLAAARILLEAGGKVYVEPSSSGCEFVSLLDRCNLIAASTPELLNEVKRQIYGEVRV